MNTTVFSWISCWGSKSFIQRANGPDQQELSGLNTCCIGQCSRLNLWHHLVPLTTDLGVCISGRGLTHRGMHVCWSWAGPLTLQPKRFLPVSQPGTQGSVGPSLVQSAGADSTVQENGMFPQFTRMGDAQQRGLVIFLGAGPELGRELNVLGNCQVSPQNH